MTIFVLLPPVVRPNIADISAISTSHIDETASMRSRLSNTTTEKFETLDLTFAPVEHFLDSCRVYLSQAINGPLLEKCRKIINTGGATRHVLTAVTHSVAH